MYVMTPYSSRRYITPNKLYTFIPDKELPSYGYIVDDMWHKIFIRLGGCSHLDGRPWSVFEDPKEPRNQELWAEIKKNLGK